MTFRIERETLACTPEQFAAAVDAYIAAATEYNEHLRGVEADAANPDLPPEQKRVAFPPPEAPVEVMQAVSFDGHGRLVPNYELVGPSLEVRKQRLVQKMNEAETAELAKVIPPGKRRYFDLREQAIRQADGELLQAHLSGGNELPGDTEDFLRSMRPSADSAFLAAQEDRRERQAVIALWAAKQFHDIEDLTDETVDGWKMETVGG